MNTFEEFPLWDETWCEYAKGLAVSKGKVTHTGDVRAVNRYWLDACDHQDICATLQEQMDLHNNWEFDTHWGSIGLPSVEVLCYLPGDRYKPHTDWGPKQYNNRKMSVTVQLSKPEDYEGGSVMLFDGPESWPVTTEQGYATVGPSWTLHEGMPVMEGERWALVAWYLGPPYR